jgi:chromosome partitioning protein
MGNNLPGRLATAEVIRNLSINLDLAPADIVLSDTEMGLTNRKYRREDVLKDALKSIAGNYDLAILDCGPSLGLLVVNGLTAAYAIIAPTLPTALDLRGLQMFIKSISEIKANLNPGLQLLGVVVCQFEARLKLHQSALED